MALELGLAEGLRKNTGKPYFILLNTRRSKEVPSDIRGLQRLEYTSYDYKVKAGLGDQLIRYILNKEYWVNKIWRDIPATGREKKHRLALKILAHLRDHANITSDNLKSLARGTHLRKEGIEELLTILMRYRLIRGSAGKGVYTRWKNIF